MLVYSMESNKNIEKRDISYENINVFNSFKLSFDMMKDIKKLDNSIEQSREEYLLIKDKIVEKYSKFSLESEETTKTMNKNFFVNARNFFIKIWGFIVSIFNKIVSFISNIVITITNFIKKYKLKHNSFYSMLKNDTEKKFTESFNYYFIGENQKDILLNKFTVPGINGRPLTYNEIKSRFSNNAALDDFIKTKIIIKDKNSPVNIENYEKILDDIYNDLQNTRNDNSLETDEIDAEILDKLYTLYIRMVIQGEVREENGIASNAVVKTLNTSSINALDRNIKAISNVICYGQPNITKEEIDPKTFFGLSEQMSLSRFVETFKKIITSYEKDVDKIIGDGGYLNVLKDTINAYKKNAVEENAKIKKMNDIVNKCMKLMDGKSEEKVISYTMRRIKLISKVINRIKTIKTDFVALRHLVSANLMTMYMAVDNGLTKMFDVKAFEKTFKNFDEEYVNDEYNKLKNELIEQDSRRQKEFDDDDF